jgi:predicted signal transduction protein with EAL and GGDEF domain
VRVAHANGGWRWLAVVATNLLHDPSVAGIVVNARDVTTAREFQDRLRHQASHDHLTGLANRSLFDQRLLGSLAGEQPACVLLVDLDGFKQINDRFGHAVGDDPDRLLRRADAAMYTAKRGASRSGGDPEGSSPPQAPPSGPLAGSLFGPQAGSP